jgi:hypothetical protein
MYHLKLLTSTPDLPHKLYGKICAFVNPVDVSLAEWNNYYLILRQFIIVLAIPVKS